MSIWSRNKPSKLSVVCDIGSASVTAGLVLFVENENPNILHTIHVPITIQKSLDQGDLEQAMLHFLETTLQQLAKEMIQKAEIKSLNNKKIEDFYAIYSSPWYVSKSSVISIKKDVPFLLDKATVEKRIDDEEKKFELEAVSGAFDFIQKKDIKMIERELVRAKLNGYETSNPFIKGVKTAELSLYMSLVPHPILLKVEELVEKHLHTKKIYSNTFPLVSYGAVRNLFAHESDFILLDIAGEMTDVSIVRNGAIIGSTSFPLGRNFIIRTVGEKFSVEPDIALSFINMKVDAGLEEGMAVDTTKVLDDSIEKWHQSFLMALKKIDESKPIPMRLFVTADEDVSEVFTSKLKEDSEDAEKWTVIELNESIFKDRLMYGKFVFFDPFISLDTLFISKHGNR